MDSDESSFASERFKLRDLYGKMLTVSHPKCDSKFILMAYDKIESYIRAPVLLNLLNLLRKSNKMHNKPHILSFFLNSFNICKAMLMSYLFFCIIEFIKLVAKK